MASAMASASRSTASPRGDSIGGDELTLVFDIHINKKYGVVKPDVASLAVVRGRQARLREVTEHLEQALTLPNGEGRFLLLQAICKNFRAPTRRQSRDTSHDDGSRDPPPLGLTGVIPLVCDEIWATLLCSYRRPRIKILVERKRPFLTVKQSCLQRLLTNKELSFLNAPHYLPSRGLSPANLAHLSRSIFEDGVRVKPKLRKGVWLHLVGVYHPSLGSREERESYIEKLRRIYDSLKGKWHGIDGVRNAQMRRLYEAVRRDAVRTDPTQPFYTHRGRPPTESYTRREINLTPNEAEDNVQKLINIIVIYTLEHDGVSYTQGMSDILSPILFVMEREADAYICFSAMLERIKGNFSAWCEGTLNKLERLRHICQVLDPQLYSYLSTAIEEDAFALFFGMVLIECRREFTFADSFHLFETIWAGVTCMKDSTACLPSALSPSQWARFMTYESQDVVSQVFGETESPYSAVPLPRGQSESQSQNLYFSRHTSLISQSPVVIEHRGVEGDLAARDSGSGGYAEFAIGGRGGGGRRSSTSNATSVSINHSGGAGEGALKTHPVEIVAPRRRSLDDAPPPPRPPLLRPPAAVVGGATATQASSDHRERSYTDPSRKQFATNATTGEPASSHSESELYDSFIYNHPSNPSIPARKKASKAPQEMSDMSSISSGTISNSNGLLASYRSAANMKNSTSSEAHLITPEEGSEEDEEGEEDEEEEEEEEGAVTTKECTSTTDFEEEQHTTMDLPTPGEMEDTVVKAESTSSLSQEDPRNIVDDDSNQPDTSQPPTTSTTTVVISHPSASDSITTDLEERNPEQRGSHDLSSPPSPSPSPSPSAPPPSLPTEAGNTAASGIEVLNQSAARLGVTAEMEIDSRGSSQSSENITGQSPSIQSNSYRTPRDSESNSIFRNSMNASHSSSFERSRRVAPGRRKKGSRRKTPTEESDPFPPFSSAAVSTDEEDRRADLLAVSEAGRSSPTDAAVVVRHKRKKLTKSPEAAHAGSRASPYNDDFLSSSARVTPVAFFDTMEQLVSSMSAGSYLAGSAGPSSRDESIQCRSRGNSDVSLILSQLRSNEEAAPRVTRTQSLDIPFSDSFPLFICLSILVQFRKQILQQTLDFVGLSVLLNTQAGVQDLDVTLRVAKQLYNTYKEYQVMCFGRNASALNTWLDDTGVDLPEPNNGDMENPERNDRASPTPDSVFD